VVMSSYSRLRRRLDTRRTWRIYSGFAVALALLWLIGATVVDATTGQRVFDLIQAPFWAVMSVLFWWRSNHLVKSHPNR
jgi:hypothetical protein